jgi:hypothetical protein
VKLWEHSYIIAIRMPAKNHVQIRPLGRSTKLMTPQKKGVYLCKTGSGLYCYYRGVLLGEILARQIFAAIAMVYPPGAYNEIFYSL